ncbi:hypothetical protein H1S01_03375 [Heliobacterium chlorum]|uniref:Uncharacterized protein n=1 Tax=Heliobacterium chlorum TaxID=2698 RepID=A0ABR7SYE7_HELCL|nr:hypothetical protein [Heliobacterium chlorum]MBC9783553.1 hypothetical protein [Heliobacterium chlorum]
MQYLTGEMKLREAYPAMNDNFHETENHIDDNAKHVGELDRNKWNTHVDQKDNPHEVTAEQVGAILSVAGLLNPGGNINVQGGTGITISVNQQTKTITITATGDATPGPHASTHATGGTDELTPADIGALPVTGGEMTGHITLSGVATQPLHATPLQQVQALIAALVNSSPSTLDTLQELAAALGNDPNFATTMATQLGLKLNSSDVVTSAQANKVLRLDSNAKLPASITGDAGSVNGIKWRYTNGYPELSIDGGGTWLKVGKGIKSVQSGVISIGSGYTTATATIAAVDITKSVIHFLGTTSGNSDVSIALARVALTNSTTVTATRVASSPNPTLVGWEVVEFE